jgi:riboflavin transporter FmnP
VKSKIDIKKLATIATLGAVAFLAMLLSKMLPPLVPFPPLQYDSKDVIILIGGFLYGPIAAAAMSAIVSLVEMVTVSGTGIIGLLMNVVSTCSFACVAAFVYKYGPKKKTLPGAVVGLLIGVVSMVFVMMAYNYLLTPIFTGYPREIVAGMLIPVFLPFNLLKGGLNASIAMLIYKPLSTALRKLRFVSVPDENAAKTGKINIGVILASLFFSATFVLLMLVFAGAI